MSQIEQHSDSPLILEQYSFLSFECQASTSSEANRELKLETKRDIHFDEKDPCLARVALVVSFAPVEEGTEASYQGSITILGTFRIDESFEENKREALVRVTACSILYGAAREQVASFTARSTQGMLTLPSVSFRESK